jgi:hypothetical protein
MEVDSETSNFTQSLESVPFIDYNENEKLGQCTDVRSLKRVFTNEYLEQNDNHILIISNGLKYGDRRTELRDIMKDKSNIYKDSSDILHILSNYGKMIRLSEYMDFFKNEYKVFVINSYETDTYINYESFEKITFKNCIVNPFILEDYLRL